MRIINDVFLLGGFLKLTMETFYIIIDLELNEAVCKENGKTMTFAKEIDAAYELSVGLLGAEGETHIVVPIRLEKMPEQRIDEVLRAATAATKAEVYSVMFDVTSNPES